MSIADSHLLLLVLTPQLLPLRNVSFSYSPFLVCPLLFILIEAQALCLLS